MADPLAGSEVQTPSVGNSLQVVMAGMANVEKEIAEVGKEIMNVEGEIDKSLAALGGGEAYRGITDKEVLQLEKDRLREKEHDLRQEKDRLRQEKDRLREMQLRLIPAPKAPAAEVQKMVQDVWEATCHGGGIGGFSGRKKKDESEVLPALGMGSRKLQDIVNMQDLSVQPLAEDLVTGVPAKENVPCFYWDGRAQEAQAQRYIRYLEDNIRMADSLMFVDAANDFPDMLDLSRRGFPSPLRRTTDVAVCSRSGGGRGGCYFPQQQVCALFELKKEPPRQREEVRAMTQLILANLLCRAYRPWVVLTDLRDFWKMYWLDNKSLRVYMYKSSRSAMVGVIERALIGGQHMVSSDTASSSSSGGAEPIPADPDGVGGESLDPSLPHNKRMRVEAGPVQGVAMSTGEQNHQGFEEDVLASEWKQEWGAAWIRKILSLSGEAVHEPPVPSAVRKMFSY
ncbi:unnamed protein product [Discosporangium mesarthrocarpum]